MFVLRQRHQRRDLLRRLSAWSAAAVTVLSILPAEASSMLGLPMGKNGLPAGWIGEALMVTLAFALPAIFAGAFVGARRVALRLGRRGIILVSCVVVAATIGTVIVDQRPELLDHLAAWIGQ